MVQENIEPAENLAQTQEPAGKGEGPCEVALPIGNTECPHCGWKVAGGEPHPMAHAYQPASPQDVQKAREEEREALRKENAQLKAQQPDVMAMADRIAQLEQTLRDNKIEVPPMPESQVEAEAQKPQE